MKKLTILALLCGAALALAVGCAQAPKPTELVEFEALRKSDYTKRVTSNEEALPYLKASDEFYALALEFYNDEEMDQVKHYSLLGAMKHRTAEAIARKEDAQKRLSKANDEYLRQQKFRNEHNSKQELLAKSVEILEREKKLLEDKIAGIQQRETEQAIAKREKALDAIKDQAEASVANAEIAQKDAEKFKAQEYAPGPYNQARNKLQSAIKFMKLENYDQAIEFAVSAKQDFEIARDEAKPGWDKEQNKLRVLEMNKTMLGEARQIFSAAAVREEGRGAVIILGGMFRGNQAKIDKNKAYLLDSVMTLARKFPEYKILIEGHTDSRGNATRNLSLSQTRSNVARDYFIERGFPVERLLTVGKGGDYPFYNDRRERNLNHRVDIVFLYPNE